MKDKKRVRLFMTSFFGEVYYFAKNYVPTSRKHITIDVLNVLVVSEPKQNGHGCFVEFKDKKSVNKSFIKYWYDFGHLG